MNDPRITSYALGELSGRERDAFERDLAKSEDLQRELNETIHLAEMLGNLPMPTDTLTEEKRAALRRECSENQAALRRKSKLIKSKIVSTLVTGGVLAAAACLLFSLSMPAITGALVKGHPRRAVVDDQSGSYASTAPLPALTPLTLESEKSKPAVEAPAPGTSIAISANSVTSLASSGNAYTGVTKLTAGETNSVAPPTTSGNVDQLASITATKQSDLIKTEVAFQSNVGTSAAPASAPVGDGINIASGSGARGSAALSAANGTMVASNKPQAMGGAAASSPVLGDIPMQGRLFETERDAKTQVQRGDFNTEAYDAIRENVFLSAKDNPLSTFSIDVDTASYANVRRFLQSDQVPPAGAIRTEELINYFSYAYPQPTGDAPFSVNLEVSRAPWDAKRELVRIGLKGREVPAAERGPANLVFLVDVSGSMNEPAKLPLLKRSLQVLVENLSPKDRVAIVVYAGSSGMVLPSTLGTEKPRILEALEKLQAGGSTNGASGIKLAYNIARENFLKEGNNRVILCTDGDFNVGTTNQSELVRLIEKERTSGVFLSVLGFGTGNLKDSTMEKLADKGNGNYAYIDSFNEGRKVLVEQMGATLFTIAKDVKIQVEFNPALVAGYRLIGYENRLLAKEDFNDDKKDAGEIGAGHAVTALYEVIPAGQPLPDQPSVDALKYQKPEPVAEAEARPVSNELLTVKLRYKAPDGDKSKLIEVPLTAPEIPAFEKASPDFQFAAAVAAFGMKLRGSPTAGDIGWSDIQKIVRANLGEDTGSYRAEFLTLIEKASRLKPSGRTPEE